jgi:flagellar biosynthesis/type III secretory pathway protein FliH
LSPSQERLLPPAVRPLSFPSIASERAPEASGGARPRRASSASLGAEELAAIKERARAEGLEAGKGQGRAMAQSEWSGRLDRAVRAREDAARALLASRIELAAEVERQLPKLVLTLTRKVIHQELAVSQTAAQTVIRGLSERLGGCDRPVVVRLAADMAEAFECWRRSEDGTRLAGPGVTVEPDADLSPGEWLLQTGDGFLDGRVESQLEEAWRLIAELPR